MGQFLNMVILVAIAVSATILKATEAAEYTVGNTTGWISGPTGGASFYSDWASGITFKEGDILGECHYHHILVSVLLCL